MDLNRYVPVRNPRVSDDQIGLALIDYGTIAIVLNGPLLVAQIEGFIETQALRVIHLDWDVKPSDEVLALRARRKES